MKLRIYLNHKKEGKYMNQPFQNKEPEDQKNNDLKVANQRKRITNIKYGFVILAIILIIVLFVFVF